MAINFPNTPSNGDVNGNFTYDSSIPGWRKTPENSASLPAGTIVQWPGATAPANWLICDGAAVSRTAYASLFAAIGVQYGAGDGTTTFNLPNLKGRVAVGLDSSQTEFNILGETGGAKTHTLTVSEMPSHTHQISVGSSGDWNDYFAGSTNTYGINPTYSGTAYSSPLSSVGGDGAHNNLQPYIVLNYIIKTSAGITSGDSELATRIGAAELDIDALQLASGSTNLSGLVPVFPASVSVGSGSANVSAVGVIEVSAASSVSLNGIFNDPYGEYVMQYTLTTSANTRPTFRARIAGSDDSGNVYYGRNYTVEQGSASAGGSTATLTYTHPGTTAGGWHFANVRFFKMYDNTAYGIMEMMGTGSYGSVRYGSVQHQNAANVDGLTLYPESASGTITGRITILKYRK